MPVAPGGPDEPEAAQVDVDIPGKYDDPTDVYDTDYERDDG